MSLRILERNNNPLLRREEIKCEFSGLSGRLTRQDAISALKKDLKIEDGVVRVIRIDPKSGTQNLTAEFYFYQKPEDERRQLPRYFETRALSKDERKRIFDERKKSKVPSPGSTQAQKKK
jgi:ribosomal protein S24E